MQLNVKCQQRHYNSDALSCFSLCVLVLILCVAFAFRFYHLEDVPPGFHIDEAAWGLMGLDILDGIDRPVYFKRMWGGESLMAYLSAVSFKLFNPSILSLRFVSAACGVLTVLGTYCFAALAFNPVTGLFAATLLATSRWGIGLARIANHPTLVAPIAVFAFYWFYKGMVRRNVRDFAISGCLIGIGFYSYLAFRLVPIVIVAVLIFLYVTEREVWENCRKPLLVFSVCLSAVSLPLCIFFLKNPNYFLLRAKTIGQFAPGIVWENLCKVALMFGVKGDLEARHNLSGWPMLPLPAYWAFLSGIAISLYHAFLKKTERLPHVFVLLWLVILLFSTLFSIDAPNTTRCNGCTPAVYILCGIALSTLWSLRTKYIILIRTMAVALVLFTGYYDISVYFNVWAKSRDTISSFDGFFFPQMQNKVQKWSAEGHAVFLPVYEYTLPSIAFMLRTGRMNVLCVYDLNAFTFPDSFQRDALFLMSASNRTSDNFLGMLKAIYPRGRTLLFADAEQQVRYIVYTVKNADLNQSLPSDRKFHVEHFLQELILSCERTPWLKDQLDLARAHDRVS